MKPVEVGSANLKEISKYFAYEIFRSFLYFWAKFVYYWLQFYLAMFFTATDASKHFSTSIKHALHKNVGNNS
jgi:hypothetical protein